MNHPEKHTTSFLHSSLTDIQHSWKNWLSCLGMNDTSGTNGSVSSLSYEEMVRFNASCFNNAVGQHELEGRKNKGTKRGRTYSEALYHIMSERKRRQDLAEKFIALSATIPGLKKIDKASVLGETIKYVQQLRQRIAMLEKGTNTKTMKTLIITKSPSCETNSNGLLPEVEARGLEKEVLIRIHCEKRKGIMLKLLALLEDVHLSIASSSVLPFGNFFLNIIIIAQMSEEYNLTVKDLVQTLKQNLLKL